MLIAYIGRFNFIHDEEQNARALERLGCHVIRLDEDSFNRNSYCNINTILKIKPDFVFYAKLEVPNSADVLNILMNKNIKTVCWHPDLYFGMPRESEIITNPIFKSTFVFSPDGGNQDRFHKMKVNHHIVRQAINDDDIGFGNNIYDIDIVYIGSVYTKERQFLVQSLHQKYGNRFVWIGSKGTNEVRGKYLSDVMTSSKVVVGDSFPSDYYWSNRIYEVLGRGGNLIHPYVKGIENEYRDGVDFHTYERGNIEMIFNLIDSSINKNLNNDMRKNAIEMTRSHHTMTHRANQILKIIKGQ